MYLNKVYILPASLTYKLHKDRFFVVVTVKYSTMTKNH